MSNTDFTLRVRTRALKFGDGQRLITHLPKTPLTFIRDGEGLVGSGVTLRLAATGSGRFEQLSKQWVELSKNAIVDDSVGGLGRGLIAFGALAFSDQSSTESVLVVPKTLVGIKDGRSWVTQIWHSNEAAPAEITTLDDFEPNHEEYFSPSLELVAGEISGSEFETLATSVVQQIQNSQVEKVVLARDLQADLLAGFDVRKALAKLAARYPTCWTYSVDGTFGASPELLVRVSHSQVSARVLAGTASRGTDPEIDRAIATALSTSTKNKREHAFAVASLVASLSPFCSTVSADESPFSLALPNVWHLASDVTAVLKNANSSLDLAGALHPTAAVAGTPTLTALSIIDELEHSDRGRYAGPVGWINAEGDGEWAIALRGAQISGEKVRAFAGCGLVAESDAAAELAETELKFQPIRYALS